VYPKGQKPLGAETSVDTRLLGEILLEAGLSPFVPEGAYYMLADIAPFGTSVYRLVPGVRSTETDLRVTESADTIRIERDQLIEID